MHWKIVEVIIHLKQGEPTSEVLYWPISLLPIMSKIFERLLINRHANYQN